MGLSRKVDITMTATPAANSAHLRGLSGLLLCRGHLGVTQCRVGRSVGRLSGFLLSFISLTLSTPFNPSLY